MFSDRRIRTSLLAIATDLFLTVFKVVLAIVTGSAALRADAFHSATDLIVSLVLLAGIFFKYKTEKNSGSGDTRLGSLVEASLALFVALIILYVPYEIISELGRESAREINNLTLGIVGTVIIIFIVLFMSKLKLFIGRETESIALEADGYHSMVDVFTSIAVLVSLIGYLVGIQLDEIIAVIIAIMIAVTGFELLISGLRSLIQKSDFDQVSIVELFASRVASIGNKSAGSSGLRLLRNRVYRLRFLLIGALIFCYFLSGFKIVNHASEAKRYTFGVADSQPLSAGLYYILPWPFGALDYFEFGHLYSVEFGTHEDLLQDSDLRIWREINQNSIKFEKTSYLITSDEQLIDLTAVVFYKVDEPVALANHLADHQNLVKQTAKHSLNNFVLSKNLDAFLSGDRKSLQEELKKNIQSNLDATFLGFQLTSVQFQTFRLPASVIAAYRDLINAEQEKVQSINRAIADRLKALPLSRAEYQASVSSAEAQARTMVLEAEGDIARISNLAEIQVKAKAGFEFDAYMKTIESALDKKEIIIKDQRLSNHDLRIWNDK